jgi:hypothetical protein
MGFVLGKDCKLYRNVNTYASPSWNEIPNCKDLDLNLETSEADVTTRGNNGWEAVVAALNRGSIDFQMVYDTADVDFAAIRDAYLFKGTIEFAVLDGDHTVAGTQGLRATCMVINFGISQPLEEAVTVDVSIKPTYAANAPSWYTIS